jgi:hypothetical protein
LDVSDEQGQSIPLSRYYLERPVAFIFLRHLECIFCSELVKDFKAWPHLNLVFISMEGPERTAAFKARHGIPHRFICDPEEKLYEVFGIPNGSILQLIGPKSMTRGIRATLKGNLNRRPAANPSRLSGAAVVDTLGRIRWSFVGRFAGDHPSPQEISNALGRAIDKEP